VSKYADPKINADGSVDIYFRPGMPGGQEENTVPGKGWFLWNRSTATKIVSKPQRQTTEDPRASLGANPTGYAV
jgi:hypothetical protein